MLGDHAYNNDMKVDPDFGKLTKSVNYLVAQIKILDRWCVGEGSNHIESVLEQLGEILENK